MERVISIKGLSLSYNTASKKLFDNFSLDINEGECLAISGESGCGKSTLLHTICGIIPKTIAAELEGEVLLSGKPILQYSRAELAARVGIVFQNPDTQLFCDTVEGELAFGLENICLDYNQMKKRIDSALLLTGLEQYRLTNPDKLSGGQKQMVVLAAVLAMQPSILLLDEALSQLDEDATITMMGVLKELCARGQTIVMVDHDEGNLAIADRKIRL